MTDAPPSRYRVVERGRRLVVIDTLTGQPATRELPVRGMASPVARPIDAVAPGAVDDRSGHAMLTTSRIYDLRGPRRLVMHPDRVRPLRNLLIAAVAVAVAVTIFLPVLWLGVAFTLLQPKVRQAGQRLITAHLDRYDQAAS